MSPSDRSRPLSDPWSEMGAANEWIEGSDTVFHKLTVFIFSDYLLYVFAAVLLIVAVVLMPLAVVSKIW